MRNRLNRLVASRYFIVIIFILIFAIRFIYLDADPSFVKRLSDIADEGIWGLDPRHAAYFDDWFIGEIHFGLGSAPLYTYLLFLAFKLFGASFFTLRFFSAISGSLTALILYFFIKKLASKKQAVLALFLFGLGNAPFVYNRLGHIESTLVLFLFLTFILWYFGSKNKLLYLCSGLFFALAFLIKFTALFFLPALFCYLIYEYFKENLHFKDLFTKALYFVIGGASLGVAYLFTFLIPNWEHLSKGMLLHGSNNVFGITFVFNVFKLLGSNLFGLPTVVILICLIMIYLLFKLDSLEKFSLSELVKSTTPLEAIALSWIFGSLLGILFSDVSDRRMTILFVPIIILISHLVIHFKRFSFQEIVQKMSSSHYMASFSSKIILYLFLLLPMFSLPYLMMRLVAKDNLLFKWGAVLIFAAYILSSLIIYLFERTSEASRKTLLYKLLLFQFTFFFLFDPITTLIRHLSRHFAIIFSLMKFEPYIIITATLFFFLAFGLIYIFLFRKKEVSIGKRSVLFILITYFLVSFLLIGNVLFAPNFSVVKGAEELRNITEPGRVVLGSADEIVYGTELIYLYYNPFHEKFNVINKDIWNYNPSYYVYPVQFDGKSHSGSKRIFDKINGLYQLELIKEINLYRYPLTNKYKMEVEVYEIKSALVDLKDTSVYGTNSQLNSSVWNT